MDTNISVDYEQLGIIKQEFFDEAERIQQVISRVDSQLNVLQNGEWVADAAFRFYGNMEDTATPGLRRLYLSLEKSGEVTHKIINIFQEAEELGESGLTRQMQFDAVSGSRSLFVPFTDGIALLLGETNFIDKTLPRFLTNWTLDKGSAMLADYLGRNGDDFLKLTKQYEILEVADQWGITKGLKKVAMPGMIGGLIDWGVGGLQGESMSTGELGVQVSSGMIQAGIGMIPVAGPVVIAGDTVVQGSMIVAEIIAEPVGNWLGFDGAAAADWIADARETVSLDANIDNLVRATGIGEGIDNVVGGAGDLIESVGDGVGDLIDDIGGQFNIF